MVPRKQRVPEQLRTGNVTCCNLCNDEHPNSDRARDDALPYRVDHHRRAKVATSSQKRCGQVPGRAAPGPSIPGLRGVGLCAAWWWFRRWVRACRRLRSRVRWCGAVFTRSGPGPRGRGNGGLRPIRRSARPTRRTTASRLGKTPTASLRRRIAVLIPALQPAHPFTHLNQRKRMVSDANRCARDHPRIPCQ